MIRVFLPFLIFIFLASCNDQGRTAGVAESTSDSVERAFAAPPTRQLNTTDACVLSEIAYCRDPQAKLDKYLPGWKLVWHPVAVNGNHAFVATDGRQYAVAIRGSLIEFSWDAFDNWIYQDLNVVVQKDWPYCEVSSAKISQGSYRGWENLNSMIDTVSHLNLLQFLEQNIGPETPILFTGHSLGGNLATVYASYVEAILKKKGRKHGNINVISFAAPAAGNESFATGFNRCFPQSVRVENTGDIVAKFPCAGRVSSLGELYTSLPEANSIMVGYKNITMPLSTVFKSVSTAMTLLEFKNGLSHFEQTNGKGTMITVKPSGRHTRNDLESWFSEAGYQHGVAQYAAAIGAPVIDCTLP